MIPAVLALVPLVLALALGFAPVPGAAQGLDFGGDSDQPIEIFADQGIEWVQGEKVLMARGNARAVKGGVAVHADVLRAYYREKPGGGTDIWRLDAAGSVRIVSPGETVTCENAVYDVDKAVLVLSGGQIRMVTADDEITAEEQMEYWQLQRMAVARGNAVARRVDHRLRADVLVARFRATEKSHNQLYRVEAFHGVVIDVKGDRVDADKAVYNADSGIATLTGSVKIVRDGNILKGCSAEVNVKSGVSKLFSCSAGRGSSGRVQGLLQPEKLPEKLKGER